MESISSSCSFRKVVFLLQIFIFFEAHRFCAADPTYGFTLVQLNGVEKFWIYNHDKPFRKHNPTRPRSEIRISGYDHTFGVWQFEGNFLVPQGTSGATIMQIFGSPKQATTLQLGVYNGDLKYYRGNVLAANVQQVVTVFINGERKLITKDHGRAAFYFKYGVYGALYHSSNYMQSSWRGIKLYKK
ncbi:citrate-binding protein-like [Pyrus ussuriensis x Pyrus communis]|uniref:Citrate-binding protein-like n=1 Tax=Pyrus ussuriensis x Pyrus communis TaxID=2448454 RepID=A0A5N5FP51_9ROSA|nr:citrate-binding protein-like [Pyrus ussuriensis x Pyrus communis]